MSATGPLEGRSWCDRDATAVAAALATGEVTAVMVLEDHLERIKRVNPEVNAMVTLAADRAMAQAVSADESFRSGRLLGPLHGLPMGIKDTNVTAGVLTTYGSTVFAHHVPSEDELVVHRVREAGAVIVGKTNAPEFGFGSHTFNRVFGVTRNPYALDRSAGGSSGGSAAALASGMVSLADGSDMGGSLRNPASFCNVVGFRPTPGRVPTFPSSFPWATLPTQGPMGRTVEDVALLLSVQAGPDPRAPLSLSEPGTVFSGGLERDLTGLRVAWSPDLGGSVPVDRDVVDAMERQVAVFRGLGAHVEQACVDFGGADESFRTLRAWQSHAMFGDLVREHPGEFKEALRTNVEAGRSLSGDDVAKALAVHGDLVVRAAEFFGRYDVLLLPVSQVVPFDASIEYPTEVAGVPQEMYLDWMRSAYLVTMLGCPAISVPGGFTPEGLPVGAQIVGAPRADRLVLEVAHGFEQATRHGERRPSLARS